MMATSRRIGSAGNSTTIVAGCAQKRPSAGVWLKPGKQQLFPQGREMLGDLVRQGVAAAASEGLRNRIVILRLSENPPRPLSGQRWSFPTNIPPRDTLPGAYIDFANPRA
jgi:hypothetical protein